MVPPGRNLLFVVLFLIAAKETSAAINCEAQTKHHACTLNFKGSYYECVVPDIYSIIEVDVHQEVGGTSCVFHPGAWADGMEGVYRVEGDTIVLSEGCRAVFLVTFVTCVNVDPPPCNGTIKRHGCSANYGTDKYECRVPNVGEILSVSIFNKVSKDADCIFFPNVSLWTPADGGAYGFEGDVVIMMGGCRGVVDVCSPLPPSECEAKVKRHGGCASNQHDFYYNCTVPNVYSIISLAVHQQVSEANCTYYEGDVPFDWSPEDGGIYGFEGNVIEVAGGCRAVFEVEFDACINVDPPLCEGGEWKRHGCSANYANDSFNECFVPNVGEIMYVSLFKQVSEASCIFYPPPIHSYWTPLVGSVYSWYGDKIVVAGGCRGVFDVCGSALGKCYIYGDPHHITVDGKKFRTGALCWYYLMKHTTFTITGKNSECVRAEVSCLESVAISGYGHYLVLNRQHIVVDGNNNPVVLPYVFPELTVVFSDGKTIATLQNGVVAEWDGKRKLVIKVPDIFIGALEGLCGDFDLDPDNDFKTPNGTIVVDQDEFISSWAVPDVTCE